VEYEYFRYRGKFIRIRPDETPEVSDDGKNWSPLIMVKAESDVASEMQFIPWPVTINFTDEN
jgi:hypothetical protein